MENGQLTWITNFIWNIAHQIESGTYLLYDGACGTGGMLTVAEATMKQLGDETEDPPEPQEEEPLLQEEADA